MKVKHLFVITVAIMLLIFCAGCTNTDQESFEGNWYYYGTAELYEFSNGNITCEENYLTLDDGTKITGTYDEHENYITATIWGITGTGTKDFYLEKDASGYILSYYDQNTPKIYFYRDKASAEKEANKTQKKIDESVKEQENYRQSIEESKSNPIQTNYDSIVAGEQTYYTVSIEGIISSWEYDEDSNSCDFDVWFWSEKENKYIQDTYWHFSDLLHTESMIEIAKGLSDGDRVNIIVGVYDDDSFGASSTSDIHIIEHGNLSDYGIIVPQEEITNVEQTENQNTERTVYIANSGSKYHAKTCRTLKDSCNEISYKTAISKGYTPCGICNPAP